MNHRSPPRYESLTEALVLDSLRKTTGAGGLAFVPNAVARVLERTGLPSAGSSVKEMIYDLAVDGKIELRPESGLNRLTPRELERCPDGPQGTKLSWARML